jgi:iron uptake system EfeUOB component EfeO/EfeM
MRNLRLPVFAAVAAVALASCGGGGGSSTSGAPAGAIAMNSSSCGGSWQLSGPGWHTFEVYNANSVGGEVDLIDPRTSGIYAEVAQFGPGTTTPMSLDVGSGKYAFRCLFADSSPLTGPTVTVSGHTTGARAIIPVTYNDLVGPAKQYQTYVGQGLATLVAQTKTLDGDVRHGDLTAARRDWLTAHLTYETLGAAYNAFGNFDDEIDGRADALGVTSPKWTGFYRLEYGLWHGQSAQELRPYSSGLSANVAALLKSWPQTEIPLIDIGLRTHEVLENALEFQLTGHDDYGSGTAIKTVLANITGTRELLSVLRPLLVPRYPALPSVYSSLDQLQSLLQGVQNTPVAALAMTTRQAIDAACGQVLEDLAPIASITDPRNT